MRVTHVIDSISPADGGPPNVVLHLAAGQAALGAQVKLVTYAHSQNPQWLSHWCTQVPAASDIELREVPRGWRFSRDKRRALRNLHRETDVMHVHGIWRSLAWHTLTSANSARAATVLAPHGMLSPWALGHHPLRKRLAMRAGWRRLIAEADTLHAVSLGERDEIRAVVSTARIALIPNGISPEETTGGWGQEITGARARSEDGYVLYLARLHQMKGPDLLIDAFAEVVKTHTECSSYRLVMAGPDYGELHHLRARVKRLGISDKVTFPGPVFGKDKQKLFRGATIVCQPSRYEAFSLSLLEALAEGVPVLTTPEANFPEVGTSGAGVICKGQPGELAQNMRRLLMQPDVRETMGRAGRALTLTKYTWDCIAANAMQVYAGLLRGSANPP